MVIYDNLFETKEIKFKPYTQDLQNLLLRDLSQTLVYRVYRVTSGEK